jgi:2-dehydropantoate 2-reductase
MSIHLANIGDDEPIKPCTHDYQTSCGNCRLNAICLPLALESEDIDQLDDNKHSAIRSLIPILNQALPHTFWNENQQASLWRKLLINSIINPLSSLYRVKNGEISSNFKIHAHAKRLSKELAPVIEHYLPGQSWQVIFDEVLCVAEQTSNNRSSMLKDIEANRPTELDFINGYLLQRAAQLGCKLEAHLELYEQMRTIRGNSSE